MKVKVELLEFIQCVLAKVLQQHDKKITPCLINKTGFYSAVYQCNPSYMHQQLNELIQQALSIAQHQLVVVVNNKNKYLELSLFADDRNQVTAKCTTPEKVIYSQVIKLPEQSISIQATSPQVNTILNSFISHSMVHFTSLMEQASHCISLIDANDIVKNETVSSDVTTIQICEISYALNPTILDASTLFWPFYDTDIINMINTKTTPEPLCILVADDSIPSLIATQAMLEKLGCKVVTANDGTRALALAQQQHFDLLLLDERMPGLYGSDVAKQLIEQDGVNRLTPKVSLTGLTEPDEIKQLFNKGITHYLEKPVTKLALENFLVQWQK
ncbi:response regulator [Shewanella saliphila]|uniref:Response regulatory domain-containing protein n=1 Tax=Shewanella saliphila TaxID=2282698 RepID=A0ABQ2Q0A0_9GAMM|nr:response regulator [Shewanella saliphila]MCL1100370.1 response regulator [Shewanella saliphila]GGP37499.1 hypothetical protein GCM10009409_00420 [Shewanella saliphila]